MAHKVFVSYHHANDQAKADYLRTAYGLSLTFNDDFTVATKENSVHPNTIKLLDILLELDAPSSSFSGFECVNITLDHEDTINRKDAKSKIVSQNYGGGDLLKNKVVKDLILSNRIIYI